MKSLLQSSLNTRVLPTGDLWYIRSDFLLFAENDVETVVLLSQQKPDDHIEIEIDLDEIDATSADRSGNGDQQTTWHFGYED